MKPQKNLRKVVSIDVVLHKSRDHRIPWNYSVASSPFPATTSPSQ
jgi:hypothetical protein